jgi:hypothetical protein
MAEKRLIAVGRKYPEHRTLYFQYATSDPHWFGKTDMRWMHEPDYDEINKVRLESSED